MLKFYNKREVDKHVSQLSQKLSEKERSTRGLYIARCYVKVKEWDYARDWLQRYIDTKPDDPTAHRLMADIYERQHKTEEAITSYQRSYKLNTKQTDIIKHVCRLYLLNGGWSSNPSKVKYWCDLAETENIQDDVIADLQLKIGARVSAGDGSGQSSNISRERKSDVGRIRVERDVRKLQQELSSSFNDEYNNNSQNGYTDDEIFHNASSSSFRNHRELSFAPNYSEKFADVEDLIRKLSDVVISVKEDVLCVRNDITSLRDDVLNIRGDITDLSVNKDATLVKAITDINKLIEELPWNLSCMMSIFPGAAGGAPPAPTIPPTMRFPPNQLPQQFTPMYNTAYPIYPLRTPLPPHLQYADPLAMNLMMNPANFSSPIIASPQPHPQQPLHQQQQQYQTPQQQQQVLSPAMAVQNGQKSSLLEALNTPSVLNAWNNTFNPNQVMPPTIPQMNSFVPPPPPSSTLAVSPNLSLAPSLSQTSMPLIQNKFVEKTPVNVVITSSDPLPTQNTIVTQPALSVTIPPQHIKQSPIVSAAHAQPLNLSSHQYESVSPSRNDANEYFEESADYDPRPDFKPIIDLPDEIQVQTGEENEDILFEERAKLFRMIEKEWKERGIGNIKILQNKESKKCRIVMRREQVHKLCANHAITPELELKKTAKETSLIWGANDYSEEEVKLEKFLIRFKLAEQAKKFQEAFEKAKQFAGPAEQSAPSKEKKKEPIKPKEVTFGGELTRTISYRIPNTAPTLSAPNPVTIFGGFTGELTKTTPFATPPKEKDADKTKPAQPSPFANFTFGGSSNKSFTELFSNLSKPETNATTTAADTTQSPSSNATASVQHEEDADHFEPTAQFEPVIPLPELVDAKTGEEDENVAFSHRAKLLRFDTGTKEWKERGLGEIKVLVTKADSTKSRLLMRREQVLKVCLNMPITKDLKFTPRNATAASFGGQDFSEGEMRSETLTIKFKTAELLKSFQEAVMDAQKKLTEKPAEAEKKEEKKAPEEATKGFGDKFKPKAGSWTCDGCYITNKSDTLYCVACDSPKDSTVPKKEAKPLLAPAADAPKFSFGMPNSSGFSFGIPQTTVSSTPVVAPAQSTTSTPASGFSFGSKPSTATSSFTFGKPAESSEVTSSKTDSESGGFKFGAQTNSTFSFGGGEKATPQPELLGQANAGFNFVLKKKSPAKVKSPGKSRNDSVNSGEEGEGEDNEYHEEEENQTYFTPVIPLPDKVEVKTGEENESVLYSHRSKLFRFTDKEWKERGIGDIKILCHNETGKIRVVMRREQVLKICLNFMLTDEVEFKDKDDTSLRFAANDFSEGISEPTFFAIRFKTKDIRDGFRKAINDALAGTSDAPISSDNDELIKRLSLPANFFDYLNAPDCAGCLGCNPDEYVFTSDTKSEVEDDKHALPLTSPKAFAKAKPRRTSQDKRVSFKLSETKENQSAAALFGGKNLEATPDKVKADLFGIKKSEASANIFAQFNAENPAQAPSASAGTSIFGNTAAFGDNKSVFGSSSIFSSSLNTTPTTTTADVKKTDSQQPGLFGSMTNFSFGSASNGGSVFGSANKENSASTFGSATTTTFGSASIFGSALNKSNSEGDKSTTNIFSSSSSGGFSFAEAAKELDKSRDENRVTIEPEFLKNSSSIGGFAELAAATNANAFNAQSSSTSGFFGLTVKEDFFSKNRQHGAADNADTSQNDSENVNDDNYDPHYDPIIALPDEVKVSTGEEEETKLFGERAKLYRYDVNTKEWKERGVGEMKILHHPTNNTYRMILRREQIFKLVLNQLLTPDLHMSPMENSPKAFCWVGMNYSEVAKGEAEQLAVRFKNEDLASSFKRTIEDCQSKIESQGNLHPEND